MMEGKLSLHESGSRNFKPGGNDDHNVWTKYEDGYRMQL